MTTSNVLEAEVKNDHDRAGQRVALLGRPRQIRQRAMALTVAPLGEIDVFITWHGLRSDHAAQIAAAGVEVIRVYSAVKSRREPKSSAVAFRSLISISPHKGTIHHAGRNPLDGKAA